MTSLRKKVRLEKYVETHSNERPYQCSPCDKGFIHGKEFKLHTGDHIGEKLSTQPLLDFFMLYAIKQF